MNKKHKSSNYGVEKDVWYLQGSYFQYIILIVVGWLFIFVLINAGLKQIVRLNNPERTPLE